MHELQVRIDGMRSDLEGACEFFDRAGDAELSATRLQSVCAPANRERLKDARRKLARLALQVEALDEVHGTLEWTLTRRYPSAGSSGYVSKRSSTKHKLHQDSPRRCSLLRCVVLADDVVEADKHSWTTSRTWSADAASADAVDGDDAADRQCALDVQIPDRFSADAEGKEDVPVSANTDVDASSDPHPTDEWRLDPSPHEQYTWTSPIDDTLDVTNISSTMHELARSIIKGTVLCTPDSDLTPRCAADAWVLGWTATSAGDCSGTGDGVSLRAVAW